MCQIAIWVSLPAMLGGIPPVVPVALTVAAVAAVAAVARVMVTIAVQKCVATSVLAQHHRLLGIESGRKDPGQHPSAPCQLRWCPLPSVPPLAEAVAATASLAADTAGEAQVTSLVLVA